jgi:SAM-dependent methyltransferase
MSLDLYRDTFNQRGASYHQAMQEYPAAREREFQLLFADLDLSPIQRVVDIPAGGGYLQRYLRPEMELYEYDLSATFLHSSTSVLPIDPDGMALPEGYFDLGICLAALHHIQNKAPFLQRILHSLKPGGYLCIGDVKNNSKEAVFLDQFAGKYNGTGHQGDYLEDRIEVLLPLLGQQARILRCQYQSCPWRFEDEAELLSFTRHLFGFVPALSDTHLLDVLQQQIGISSHVQGLQLQWGLLYITLQKQAC